jgi:hypothetical protein
MSRLSLIASLCIIGSITSSADAALRWSLRNNPITSPTMPAGAQSYSLMVEFLTPGELFNTASLKMTLPAGSSFYNNLFGSDTTPNPALVAAFPDLAYDTYVATTAGFAQAPSIPGRAGDPGAAIVGQGQNFDVSWGATPNTGGTGELEIARFTWTGGPGFPNQDVPLSRIFLSSDPNAFGFVNFLAGSGVIVPEPASAAAVAMPLIVTFAQRRHRRRAANYR